MNKKTAKGMLTGVIDGLEQMGSHPQGFTDLLREALESLSEAPSSAEWIRTSERVPEYYMEVLIANSEGVGIAQRLPEEQDGPDSMGHDEGFLSVHGTAFPGRSFGNPDYQREPQDQPTHWMPLPAHPLDVDIFDSPAGGDTGPQHSGCEHNAHQQPKGCEEGRCHRFDTGASERTCVRGRCERSGSHAT